MTDINFSYETEQNLTDMLQKAITTVSEKNEPGCVVDREILRCIYNEMLSLGAQELLKKENHILGGVNVNQLGEVGLLVRPIINTKPELLSPLIPSAPSGYC